MKLYNFITERPLSNKEKGKKEKIVKGMKGAKSDFKKRYGDDAKSVMYATATKLAKNESLQALARHVKEGVPLPDSLFRYQSEAYFDTFKQAKQLREAGALPELDWESEEMLGTDIGESVVLKGGKRVWLDVPYLDESDEPNIADGMIGVPDQYYDEEERKEAYNDLQTALDGIRNDWEKQSVIDGVCPECSGTSHMDGDYDNDEDSCYGWGNYGCDQGEMENASWVEIIKHDQRNADRQKAKDNYPGDDELIDQVANMVKNMDDPRDAVFQLQADYPHMGKAQRAGIVAKAMKKAGLTTENTKDPMSKGDCETCKGTGFKDGNTCPVCDGDGEDPGFGGTKSLEKSIPKKENIVYEDEKSGEAMVAKLLAKALGDENRWSEMSAQELYAELESQNPELADTINDIGRILYGVRMQESSDSTAMKQGVDAYNKQNPNQDKEICPLCDGSGKWENKECPSCEGKGMFEAEYQGKEVELNKPKRGGSKKYYVYVKNPKTGNVKKISFGDVTGLRTKSGNAKRAKSFAARHNCEKKNDKTKAGYWACRLPRYGLVKGGKWW